MAGQSAVRRRQLPGYAEELERAESDIAALESALQNQSGNSERRTRLAYRLFHRASLSGRTTHFDAVEITIREAIEDFGPKEDLCLLKAHLDFRFHRLREVRRDLQMCPLLSGRFEGRVLMADLDFQEGRYETARLEFERRISENRTWDTLARLAHWTSKLGDAGNADELYQAAEDELTAKQMRSYAWLEVQRGLLAFTHGRYEDAWKNYRRADEAYPGHWYTDEHVAELMAAEGRFQEAADLLQKVIAQSPRPELQQSIGELYVLSGHREEAQQWFASAEAAYLESVQRGDVHYFHHLADFYAGPREEPAAALRWARVDLELRSNYSTQAAMAWALYRSEQLTEAVEHIRLALSSGVQDAQLFSTAATLFEAAGEMNESESYAEAALAVNPKHRNFQMHH